MSKNTILVISIALMVGCAIPYFFTVPVLPIAVVFVLAIISLFFVPKESVYVLIFLVLIFSSIGFARTISIDSGNLPEHFLHSEVTLVGVIVSDIENKKNHSRYEVALEKINNDTIVEGTKVLVYDSYPTSCVRGEKIVTQAKLQEPKDFETSTGRMFAYKKHLIQRGIYAVTFVRDTGCVGYAQKGTFNVFAFFRENLIQAIHSVLPQQEATLLGGLLLGLRGNFSDELLEFFRMTGLLHIIVLSGYNVSLVAESIRRLTAWMSAKVSLMISLFAIGSFVLLAGAQTAAIRAGGMGSISLVAKTLHREYEGIRTLIFVTALMILYNPDQLFFSISLHMSFLATLGILLFSNKVERLLGWLPDKFQIRGIVAVTTSTQLFLVLYLAYAIGEVSLIGFLANIVVLPLVPIAMLFGGIVAVVSLVSEILALIFMPLAYIPLKLIIFLTEYLSAFPLATLPLPEISGGVVAILYAVIIGAGLFFIKNNPQK